MNMRVLCLPGDGIGPEVMAVTRPLVEKVAEKFGHQVQWDEGLVGFAAYDKYQDTMPKDTWDKMHAADAVLFGAVGLPARDGELKPEMRPEKRALLPMRKEFGLSVNIRPIRVFKGLEEISPLKSRYLEGGVDLTFFRELNSGIYYGEKKMAPDGSWATDTCYYNRQEIERIARAAFETARRKGVKVTSVDKANVLNSIGLLWRQVVTELHDAEYADVQLEHVLVDAFNLYLFTKPSAFRIVLTGNMFGDILSDGAAGLAGSLGLLPSASLNPDTHYCLYEPSGGSAPDIAGKDIANPIAMILSGAMLFRYSYKDEDAAACLELAVQSTLNEGYRTRDLVGGSEQSGLKIVGTTQFAQAVLKHLA